MAAARGAHGRRRRHAGGRRRGSRGRGGGRRGAGAATGSEAEHGGSSDTCNGESGALDGLHFGFSFIVPIALPAATLPRGLFRLSGTDPWLVSQSGIRAVGGSGWVRIESLFGSHRRAWQPSGSRQSTQKNPGPKTGALQVCARGDLNPHARRHRNLNPACLPISPLARGSRCARGTEASSTADASLHCTFAAAPPGESAPGGLAVSTFRSRRSLATWPVARTLYWATTTLPSGSTTTVDRISPS